jgi:hypothetical protein
MTQELQILAPDVIQNLLLYGDLSRLTSDQKIAYVKYRCQSLGLDAAAKPFELLKLNGKEILYATKACTEQLCESRKLSVALIGQEMVGDVMVVTARVSDKERSTENVGAVSVGNLQGDPLANALMKCRTKAVRRTVLSHCGLGMMDELETETIPNAVKVEIPAVLPASTPAQEKPGERVEPQGPPQVVLPGDYITPFGAGKKGKPIKDLTDGELQKGIAWCSARGQYPEWCDNATAYLANPDLTLDRKSA